MRRIVEEARAKYGPVEVKRSGSNYYLSRVSSVYDPAKKRARKISGEYLGKITREGLVRAARRNSAPRSVYEYGNARILYDSAFPIMKHLREYFPSWREILAMAIVRTIRPAPMKYLYAAWEKLYLSMEVEASLSPSTLSDAMRAVGKDWASQRAFFRELITDGDRILFDLSSIFSRSENIRLAEKGYNRHRIRLQQINFAMAFSHDSALPCVLKPLPGSLRDVKSLQYFLEEFDLSGSTLILDRGFFSYKNVQYFLEHGIGFVQPLKRGSTMIDYATRMQDGFAYRKRGILQAKIDVTDRIRNEIAWGNESRVFLYIYEDVRLRGEEESNLILLMREGKIRSYDRSRLGKVSLLSSMDKDPSEVYELYKEREGVEQAFDAMKNELEEDKVYLHDDESVWGYFFVAFLSIYLYYSVLAIIRAHDLTKELSVNEVLLQLSRIYMVKYMDGGTGFLEIPKKVENLCRDLELDILPKIH